MKQYNEHAAGKKHRAAVDAADSYWTEFCASSWFDEAEAAEAGDELRIAATAAWSLDDFVEGLPRRSRSRASAAHPAKMLGGGTSDGCIDPHVTLSALSPLKRARLWRYLRDLIPSRPALPEAVARLEAAQPRFGRVKEILESCEAFLHAERAALAAGGEGGEGGDGEEAAPTRPIFDVACGHGLVGALLAYRFPRRRIVAVDLERRPAFDAWVGALRGDGCDDADESALSNLRFVQGDFASISFDSPSLVLCVHGCNEVNRDAIEFARRSDAAWLVLPCCLRVALYMDALSVKLPDDTRYALLCGAMAGEYDAELVESIDRRISPRAIVIGGGGVVSAHRRRS